LSFSFQGKIVNGSCDVNSQGGLSVLLAGL